MYKNLTGQQMGEQIYRKMANITLMEGCIHKAFFWKLL